MAYIGKTPVIGNFVKLDSITAVNGQAAYTMQNGGVNFTSYDNVNQFLVSLNGVLQAPTDSFTVSGSTLTFASNLSTGDVIDFVMVLGNSLDIGTPSDNTITTAKLSNNAVTNAKLSFNANQFRNIIINGDMSIAQRSTSETGVTSGGYYTCDRWYIENTTMGTFTISQSTDVPSGQGFAKSLKFDCTTADASPASGDTIGLRQKFEGQNLQYLKFATSSAESLTLSFWIKSNKTGTYNVALFGQDSASTAQYLTKAYTISSADTWEKKTITYPGNTANGFDNDNARSLDLTFNFGTGSSNTGGTLQTVWSNYGTSADYYATQGVNIADNTANELYITGVQLEAGTSASDFEFLPYDINLKRCERYFYQAGTDINGAGEQNIGIGQWYSASEIVYNIYAPTTMRTKPSLITPTVINGYRFHKAGSFQEASTAGSISDAGNQILAVYKSGMSGGTGGQATFIVTKSSPAKIQFSAEL